MPRNFKRTREEWVHHVWDRRECVVRLLGESLSIRQIAMLCGVTYNTAREDIRAIRNEKSRPPPDRIGAHATKHVRNLKMQVAQRLAWSKLKWPTYKTAPSLTPTEVIRLRDTLREEDYYLADIATMFNTWKIPTRTGVPWTHGTVRYLDEEHHSSRRIRLNKVAIAIKAVRNILDESWTVPTHQIELAVYVSTLQWEFLAGMLREDGVLDQHGRQWSGTSLRHFCEYYKIQRAVPYGLRIKEVKDEEEDESQLSDEESFCRMLNLA